MVLSYSLALLYGVFQLWVLASPTRTIRFRTAVTGFVCGAVVTFPLAVLLEWGWIRLADRWVEQSRLELMLWASWTVDPFIEELVRLVPLVTVLVVVPRCRRQWSMTDLVVMGASLGSGYRWGEHLARFPGAPDPAWGEIAGHEQGWFIGGLDFLQVDPPSVWLFNWVPEGVTSSFGDLVPAALFNTYNVLLVWGTLGGLAVALWTTPARRATRRLLRSTAIVLVAAAGLSHASVNAQARGGEWPFDVLVLVRLFEPWFWAWPLFALGAAIAGDRVRAVGSEVDTSRFRVSNTSEAAALLKLARQQPLASLPAVLSFIRIRRQVLNTLTAAGDSGCETTDAVADATAATASTLRAQLDNDSGLWAQVRLERTELVRAKFNRLVRWPGILAWPVFVGVGFFPLAYFVIGGTSRWPGVQDWFTNHPAMVVASTMFGAVVTAVIAGLSVIRWSTIADTAGELKARLLLGLFCQGFALAGTGLILYRYQTFPLLDFPLITDIYHGLEAMAVLLLIVGLAALLLATGIVALPAGAVLLGVTTTELAIGGVLMSASGLALLNYAHRGAYTQAVGGAIDSIGDTIVQATDSGKNEPHGDAGRRQQQAEALIAELEARLAELIRTQGSKAEKDKLRDKIKNIRRAAERAKKGETHGRRSKRRR